MIAAPRNRRFHAIAPPRGATLLGPRSADCARRSFLGQKQFSLEGLDAMMPMLDEAIQLAADAGAHEVVIGMAHRGRLNVLVHTVGRSYESIQREF